MTEVKSHTGLKKLSGALYFWVLIGIVLGGVLGFIFPEVADSGKVVSEAFISLIKMLIGPFVFCTVVLGIAGAGDLKKAGRVGLKALIYFEVVSTFALAIGLVVVNFFKPGAGVAAAAASGDVVAEYAKKAESQNFLSFIVHIIPKTFVDSFTGQGDLLQILLIAVLFGVAINQLKESAAPVHNFIEATSHIFFGMVSIVMKAAPLGAGAAMAFTVGKLGIDTIKNLMSLMLCFYGTCLIFILGVLGLICRYADVNIFKFLSHIKEELLTVLGTSSSESAIVPLMKKLEGLGCSQHVVSLVVPTGYSFNLDGTNIYLTMAALFIAQAYGVDLSLREQLTLLLLAAVTSKGASGVTGAGFVALASTLTVIPAVPIVGLSLILGIDRFMSEARALTNIIGNAVATLVIAKWEKELDKEKLKRVLG